MLVTLVYWSREAGREVLAAGCAVPSWRVPRWPRRTCWLQGSRHCRDCSCSSSSESNSDSKMSCYWISSCSPRPGPRASDSWSWDLWSISAIVSYSALLCPVRLTRWVCIALTAALVASWRSWEAHERGQGWVSMAVRVLRCLECRWLGSCCASGVHYCRWSPGRPWSHFGASAATV